MFVFVLLTLGVYYILYIILLYYYILYIYIYYIIILLYTIPYTILFSSFLLSLPNLSFSSPLPIPSHSHSKYTCRYLHILIYIHHIFPIIILTPHVLSEWMVEVCRFYMYPVLGSGSGSGCVLSW